MGVGIFSNNFSLIFNKLLEQTGVTCYRISQFTHLDQAYLSRLRNNEKQNPSAETVVKIALALAYLSEELNIYDLEQLVSSIGRSLHIKY